MTIRESICLVLGVLAASTVAGCGTGRLPVYPVTGQVLVKGEPADGAFVVFHPVEPTGPDAQRPYATVGPDGTFRLTTYELSDGAPAGRYRVTIVWRPKAASALAPEGKDRLDGRYANAESAKLEVTLGKQATTLEPFRLD